VIDEHRHVGALEQSERAVDHVALEDGIAGLAERSTERELAVQDARRSGVDRLLADQ
jgi:hypothetical protein